MEPSVTTPLLGHHGPDSAPQQASPAPSETLPRKPLGITQHKRLLGFWDGLALVLGLQIGSGIFVSPALVVRSVGSEPTALLIWVVGGVLAWACAACYSEMGTRLPVNGGPQEYLTHCFGDMYGFLASWGCIFTVKPCSGAILALSIAEYLCNVLALDSVADDGGSAADQYRKLAAFVVIALVTAVNCAGNRLSNVSTKVLLACKVGGVGFIIVMGVVTLLFPELSTSPPAAAQIKPVQPEPDSYIDALLAVMWAYSGWETLAFVGGELQNPRDNIPRVINTAMAVVVLLSVLSNMAYFSALSFEDITRSPTIGLTFSRHFLGRAGGVVFTAIICLSSLGTLNVKTFTAGRLTQAAAERGFLPPLMMTVAHESTPNISSGYSPRGPQHGILGGFQQPLRFGNGSIPFSAIIFNSLLTSIFILVGDLRSLISFVGIVEYWVVFLTLIGLLSLRLSSTRPDSPGHDDSSLPIVKVPFILIPIALLAVTSMVVVTILRHQLAGIGFLMFCIASAAFYALVMQPASSIA